MARERRGEEPKPVAIERSGIIHRRFRRCIDEADQRFDFFQRSEINQGFPLELDVMDLLEGSAGKIGGRPLEMIEKGAFRIAENGTIGHEQIGKAIERSDVFHSFFVIGPPFDGPREQEGGVLVEGRDLTGEIFARSPIDRLLVGGAVFFVERVGGKNRVKRDGTLEVGAVRILFHP